MKQHGIAAAGGIGLLALAAKGMSPEVRTVTRFAEETSLQRSEKLIRKASTRCVARHYAGRPYCTAPPPD